MRVILLEKIRKLGVLGDVVKVKPGYGRNFLIPTKKAVFATEANVVMFETRRAEFEKKAAQSFSQAQERAAKIQDMTLVIAAQASDEGKLFGSVGVSEIQAAFEAKSFKVSKREIMMPEGSFHSVGQFPVDIQVHSDLMVTVQVEIVAAK